MSAESRWFRVNCDWWESDWVCVLSAEARLAWVLFLGRVKTHGFGGRLKQTPTHLLARQWMIGEEAVMQIIKAAEQNGAIVSDGDAWVVTGWAKYQGDATGAERQRRLKESKGGNGGNALVTGVTTTETETETITETLSPPSKLATTGGNGGGGDGGGKYSPTALQDAVDECYEIYPKVRKGPNPRFDKEAIKSCLMACGKSPPLAHYAEVVAGTRRMVGHFASRPPGEIKFAPSMKNFFAIDGLWRGEWLPADG